MKTHSSVRFFLPFAAFVLGSAALCALFLAAADPSALLMPFQAAADSILPFFALAALVICVMIALLPQSCRKIPHENDDDEKLTMPLWLIGLTSLFCAANAPLFLLENAALAVMPAHHIPMTATPLSPLPWAFPALAAACIAMVGKKHRLFRALSALAALGAVTALLCRTVPVISESFIRIPIVQGATLPAWAAIAMAAAVSILLRVTGKSKSSLSAGLWGALALLLVFLTACGIGPVVHSTAGAVSSFVRCFSGLLHTDGAALAWWLCWSPAIALVSIRFSRGRSLRQTILGVYFAGFVGAALMHVIFGAFAARLLESAAEAGLSGLAAGETLAASVAGLMLSLPFPGMDEAVLFLAMVLICASALGLAVEPLRIRSAALSSVAIVAAMLPAFCAALSSHLDAGAAITSTASLAALFALLVLCLSSIRIGKS